MVHVVTRMPRWLKLQSQWVDRDYTLDTITPSASPVARHRHITQPRGARGDSLTAFPSRALSLGFSKRRRDAVAEPRILLRLRSGAAVSELRDSCFHERRVAAALAQQCRPHALNVRYADALARRGHDGFSERPAFRSRASHRHALVARTAFAHAFRYSLLAATPDAAHQACVHFFAVAQRRDDALGCCTRASIHSVQLLRHTA